ncbi:hypothetical protein NL43_04590 [Methanosphaera sp. WGK6]|nr:hypothetical protein NL43_04590 [Methanosphaera sp. WGK6]
MNQENTSTSKDEVIKTIEKYGGITVTGPVSLYNNFKKFKYDYYYNDIYPLSTELKRIANNQGLNCTDLAQLYYTAYKEMGFTNEIQIVRGTVTCKSGKTFGHVWCRVKDDGKWINVDPSAAAAHGYSYGTLICTNGYTITNINPNWALSDDGKT